MKPIILLLMFIFSVLYINAQNIYYAYDKSGNRVQRTLEIQNIANPNGNTITETEDLNNEESIEVFYEYFKNSTVKIYPNPTYGKLKIELDSKLEAIDYTVTIYDLQGREVFSAIKNSTSIIIDLTDHSKGTYLLKIQLGECIREWKIVKV